MSLVSPCSPSNLLCELQLKPSVSLLDDSLQLQAIELLPGSTKKGRKLSTSTLRLAGSESPLSFVEMGGWVEESVSFKNLKIELISNTHLKENTFFRINQHSGRWIRRETFTRVPFFNSFASPAVVLGVFAFLQCIHALRLPLSPAMWTKHLLKHEKYMIFERVLGWGCCLDKTAHSHVKGFTCRPKVSPITHAFAVINTIPLKAQQYATIPEKVMCSFQAEREALSENNVYSRWWDHETCEELRGSLSNLSFCVGQVVFQQAVSTVFLVLTSKIEIVVLLFIRVKLIIFFKIILYHITTYLTFSSQILCKTTVHIQI